MRLVSASGLETSDANRDAMLDDTFNDGEEEVKVDELSARQGDEEADAFKSLPSLTPREEEYRMLRNLVVTTWTKAAFVPWLDCCDCAPCCNDSDFGSTSMKR